MWISPKGQRIRSRNHSPRHGEGVEGVVMHWTASPHESAERERQRLQGWALRDGASTHFAIMRNGDTVQMVPTGRAAWHTSDTRASWHVGGRENPRPVDRFTIGVDLMNVGPLSRQPDNTYHNVYKRRHTGAVAFDALGTPYEPFTAEQIGAVRALVYELCAAFPVLCDPSRWTGHEDIQPGKIDPGPLFPWADVRQWVRAARDGVCV